MVSARHCLLRRWKRVGWVDVNRGAVKVFRNFEISADEAGGDRPLNHGSVANARVGVGVDVANFAGAYLAAVVVSAIVYGVQYCIEGWVSGAASSVPMPYRLIQIAEVSAFGAMIFAMLALWLALVPAAISALLARRLGVDSLVYYVMCGVVSAVVLAPINEWIFRHDDGSDSPPTFEELCIRRAFHLMAPAIVGAIAFWFVAGRLRAQSPTS